MDRARIARQTKSGLKQLKIRDKVLDRIARDLLICEVEQIVELRAQAAVVDRVMTVLNSEIGSGNDGNDSGGNAAD